MEKPFVVYGAKGSGSVPVEAVLTLLGLGYEVVEAPAWEGEAERARVGAVNPMRQIPALVLPSGEVLTESAAILIWLAEQYPQARLAPRITAAPCACTSSASSPSQRTTSSRYKTILPKTGGLSGATIDDPPIMVSAMPPFAFSR